MGIAASSPKTPCTCTRERGERTRSSAGGKRTTCPSRHWSRPSSARPGRAAASRCRVFAEESSRDCFERFDIQRVRGNLAEPTRGIGSSDRLPARLHARSRARPLRLVRATALASGMLSLTPQRMRASALPVRGGTRPCNPRRAIAPHDRRPGLHGPGATTGAGSFSPMKGRAWTLMQGRPSCDVAWPRRCKDAEKAGAPRRQPAPPSGLSTGS